MSKKTMEISNPCDSINHSDEKNDVLNWKEKEPGAFFKNIIKSVTKIVTEILSSSKNNITDQLKTTCEDIVHIIENTDKNNFQEQAKALYDKSKWIDDNQEYIKKAIPASSHKQFTFMLKNRQYKEIFYWIGYCSQALTLQEKKDAIKTLKDCKKQYLNLWF